LLTVAERFLKAPLVPASQALDALPRCINRVDLDAEGRPTQVSFGDKVAAAAALLRSLPGAPAESTVTVNATAVAGAAAVGDSHRPSDHVRAEVRSLLAAAEADSAGR
jgi:hypothetical protein